MNFFNWIFRRRKVVYIHREVNKDTLRSPSPVLCPQCGKYEYIPLVGCRKCDPPPEPRASAYPAYRE